MGVVGKGDEEVLAGRDAEGKRLSRGEVVLAGGDGGFSFEPGWLRGGANSHRVYGLEVGEESGGGIEPSSILQ